MTDKLIEALVKASRTARADSIWDRVCEDTAAVRAVLAELDRQGFAVVPKELTEQMFEVGWLEMSTLFHNGNADPYLVWKELLAAAPKLGEK